MADIDAELDTAKKISTDLVGPVYDADLSVNHFKEVVMHAEAIRKVEWHKISKAYFKDHLSFVVVYLLVVD